MTLIWRYYNGIASLWIISLFVCHNAFRYNERVLTLISLRWRHNEPDGVSNHQPYDCLHKRLFSPASLTCEGNSPVTGEFLAQRASNAENVSIWWRHHMKQHYSVHISWLVLFQYLTYDLQRDVPGVVVTKTCLVAPVQSKAHCRVRNMFLQIWQCMSNSWLAATKSFSRPGKHNRLVIKMNKGKMKLTIFNFH